MISKRLKVIASLIPQYVKVFDIGCDHGYLSIYLFKYNNNKVVASDITTSCVLKAQNNILKENLDIEVIKTGGLLNLNITKKDYIVIAGMGTHTIINILKNSYNSLSDNLIIQSNNNLDTLRKVICKLGYYIDKEEALLDKNKYYVIIRFKKGYKKYNKYKRALGEIKQQQEETTTLLTYLESLATSLDTATTKNEINEIKSEIIDLGLLAKPRKKSPGQESSKPMTIVLNPTTTLIVGKNNKQNDFVTFKLGKANDLWFHVKNIPGSHVILKSTLPNPEEKDILQAAAVAAAFSKAKNSSKVPVDYTQKRFVKKPSGAKPGFVIYTDQQTLYVTPGLPGKN